MELDLTELSRAISHALRHEPWLYELELDEEGWAPINDLIIALRNERSNWFGLTEIDVARMIANSSKQRHEMLDGRIRALYGHSLPGRLAKSVAIPPDILYHGTAPDAVQAIRENGLLPMGRQYVHLSADEATAYQVGKRKAIQPVILGISASIANASKIQFYRGNERVWLSDYIPSQYIVFD